jgi:uncharacterized DUF497 family protein
MKLEFEWEELKADANLKKHKVSFAEARSVFSDSLAKIFYDATHSVEEHREIIVGYSEHNRLLLVSFTERKLNIVRIISARKATKAERKVHEENKNV